MSMIRSLSTFVLVVAPCALFACPSSSPKPVAPSIATGSASSSPSDVTSASPTAAPSTSTDASTSGSASGSPFGNNFAVKAPKFSADTCTKDAECGPVATCHSDSCVALSHTGSMAQGTLCTMDCRGGTVDCGFNHCGCAPSPSGGGKRCALLPGPK